MTNILNDNFGSRRQEIVIKFTVEIQVRVGAGGRQERGAEQPLDLMGCEKGKGKSRVTPHFVLSNRTPG